MISRTLLAAAVLFALVPAQSQAQLPEGDGKAIVERACGVCHSLEQVARGQYSRQRWEGRINRMIEHGAVVRPEEIPIAADYLAKNFPAVPDPPAVVIPGPIEISIMEWKTSNGVDPHDPMVAPDGSIWYASTGGNVVGRLDPTKARRDMNGWRVYTYADIATLRQILFPGNPNPVDSPNAPDQTDN